MDVKISENQVAFLSPCGIIIESIHALNLVGTATGAVHKGAEASNKIRAGGA